MSHPPMSDPHPVRQHRGPLAWMSNNTVAANLLLVALLLGGLLFLPRVKQEVFPEFEIDVVTVNVVYPGASPEEVEKGVTQAIEENVRGIDGVKKVTSTSREGTGSVVVELLLGADSDKALNDIKAAVDRITSFPRDVEEPIVSRVELRSEVLSLVLYGDAPEKSLRALADRVRNDLLQDKHITQVELASVRPLEISVEVPREKLQEFNLTLEQVANAIRAANVEVPAGGIKTERGEILLRTAERRDYGLEYRDIALLSRPDGSVLKLGDVARIDDSFAETDQESSFNGKPAAMVRVYRVGAETPIEVANAVHEYVDRERASLPRGVDIAVWNDRSEMYRDRIDLLMRNAYLGLALVMLCLGLFLDVRLAFWVTVGIPTSFLGALLFLPAWDVSINMISLFAFIVTLGIVVDDAIVVSEAVYKRRQDGLPPLQAAVTGVHDVARPVIFSVLTTVVAFSPLLFVPGVMGKFFRNIPTVVIVVLLISLVESLFILPAHLSHENPIARLVRRGLSALFGENMGPFGWLGHAQQRFSRGYERLIESRFRPVLEAVTSHRWVTLAAAVGLLLTAVGVVAGGRIAFTFFPKIESDVIFAQLKMPYGTPAAESKKHMLHMVQVAEEVVRESGDFDTNVRGVFAQVGAANFGGMGRGQVGETGAHISEVALLMTSLERRTINAADIAEKWRRRIGEIPGADSLKFTFTTGASADAPISVQLSHSDVPTLERAAEELASRLRAFRGVKDIDDGVSLGKRQLDFELTPEARALGITESDLARQVRSSFFGAEAVRQQRERDEVRVYVRLPDEERGSLHDLDALIIRTPQGGEIPLAAAATTTERRAYTSIAREDGRRVITVSADVEEGVANANEVMAELTQTILPELMQNHAGLTYGLSGQQQNQAESLAALSDGLKLALIVMFALMAIPLKSYIQPAIIMVTIPFGAVGAIAGHLLLGYDLSMLSMMGLVALSGVVVNDSIVLIDAINEFRRQGMPLYDAVIAAGVRRFRPIMLTSLTTFLGLAPMIFETSVQARFLVPMAISLGFGVLFATFITLLMVPSLYLVLYDALALVRGPIPEGAPAE